MKFERVGNIVTIHKGKKHELIEEKNSSSVAFPLVIIDGKIVP